MADVKPIKLVSGVFTEMSPIADGLQLLTLGVGAASPAQGVRLSNTNAALVGTTFTVDSNTTGAITNGAVRIQMTGAHTGNAVQVDDATATGTVVQINPTALTTGTGLRVNSTNAAQTGNSLLVNSNSTGVIVGGIVRFTFSGAHTGQGFLISDVATTGTVMQINPTALTSGSALTINGTTATQTGTSLLVTSNSTGAVANGLVRLNFTGAHTGNGLQVNDVTATGTAVRITTTALSSGKALDIVGTGTAAASNTQTMLSVSTSGANATATQTTFGVNISNTHTGTGSTNIALRATASGGATANIAVDSVGLLRTTEFQLTTSPTAGFVLGSDANGVGTWVSPTGTGMVIGGTVTGGTAGSVLFLGAGPVLAEDNANIFWDDINNFFGIGTANPGYPIHVRGSTDSNVRYVAVENQSAGSSAVASFVAINNTGFEARFGTVGSGWVAGTSGADANFALMEATNIAVNAGFDLRLASNGTPRLVVSSANVYLPSGAASFGVGLTNPGYPIHVQGSTDSNVRYVAVENQSAGSSAVASFVAVNNTGVQARFGATGSGWVAGTSGADASWALIESANVAINAGFDLRLASNGTPRLVVSSASVYLPSGAASFGVGLTTPGYPIHVQGSANSNVRYVAVENQSAGSSAVASFVALNDTSIEARFGITGTGWVAGTSGADASWALIESANVAINALIGGSIRLSTNGTPRLAVDTNVVLPAAGGANLGIGVAVPTSPIEIERASATEIFFLSAQNTDGTDSAASAIRLKNDLGSTFTLGIRSSISLPSAPYVAASRYITASGSNIVISAPSGVVLFAGTYTLDVDAAGAVNLNGESARSIVMARTTNTTGQSLTVTAGGAGAGESDEAGGALILSAGISTGSAGSNIEFKVATGGASGSTDRTPATALTLTPIALTQEAAIGTVTKANTPAALTASVNDYDLGPGYFFRQDATAGGWNITGFAGGVDGRQIVIIANGGNGFNITNNDAASAIGNRVRTGNTGATITLLQHQAVTLIYDAVDGYWRVLSVNAL